MRIVFVIFTTHHADLMSQFYCPAEILSTDVTQMDEVVPDAGLPLLALQVLYI